MDMFIKVVRDNYANFEGRARRNEFWMFVLIATVISLGTFVIDGLLFPGKFLTTNLFSLAILVPNVAVSIRRLHDTGRSGWTLLLAFSLIGVIPLFVFLVEQSHASNQYGPTPDGVVGPKPWKDLY